MGEDRRNSNVASRIIIIYKRKDGLSRRCYYFWIYIYKKTLLLWHLKYFTVTDVTVYVYVCSHKTGFLVVNTYYCEKKKKKVYNAYGRTGGGGDNVFVYYGVSYCALLIRNGYREEGMRRNFPLTVLYCIKERGPDFRCFVNGRVGWFTRNTWKRPTTWINRCRKIKREKKNHTEGSIVSNRRRI